MPKMTLIEAVRDALAIALREDPRVVIFGEDVGQNGGVFRATDGLQAEFGEARVVDTPLAEKAIVGTAVGLAMAGMKPVAEIQFLGFAYEAMDQIAAQLARIRFRTQGRFAAPAVIRAPYGGGVRTPELHSDSLEALFAHTPGLVVVTPSRPYDAKGLLLSAIHSPDPVVFLEPIRLYRAFREEVPEGIYEVPIGRAALRREGSDVTLIAWGPTVSIAESAAAQVATRGIDCEVLDLRTLAPLDRQALKASVEKTGRAVIVHEAVRYAGLGAEIAASIMDLCFYHLRSPIERVAGFDTPYPPAALEDAWLPSVTRVVEAIERAMEA
ncbi:alpha-ketoacid dehydrogenase subunit beta [Alicyclobacillus vulcanalis]|uniref:Pyruvate dehydrogenase E1 component beta subunit n=1 Tax=Alicyclobacillus vulcanalis TaxID=252246 RepID=A0A1N7M2H7_9BACL|nr:alpha-ketoacid dehydrogenase subunit beta [Alicyclobacillus vulcanalis]SIS80253.1 pyruvate dehydrogenase E1 component beta subunit [Alicyclobacillus vulcanalis]